MGHLEEFMKWKKKKKKKRETITTTWSSPENLQLNLLKDAHEEENSEDLINTMPETRNYNI